MTGPRSILNLFESQGGPPPQGGNRPRVYSVTDLCREAKSTLEGRFSRMQVQGEISGLTKYRSGHWYFSLKDAQSCVSAVMFSGDNRNVRFPIKDGLLVTCTGKVSLYEPRGQFQFIVNSMSPAGAGELAAAYEALKAKLQAEGLFDRARKKPLPPWPRAVGVVTSMDGAAIRDILTVLERRAPDLHVVIAPARVQGPGAAADVAQSLQRLDQSGKVDVIIIGRGGGSAEDLWCFNDEQLARVIVACKTPVVSAVGHETDVTISDWVADRRAPTPSAAAELVAPDRGEQRERLEHMQARLVRATRGRIDASKLRLMRQERRMPNLRQRVMAQSQRLDDAEMRLRAALQRALRKGRNDHARVAARLSAAHPSVALRAQRTRLQRLERLLLERMPPRIPSARDGLHALDNRLHNALNEQLSSARERLIRATASLEALSPLSVLTRGYSVVTRTRDGAVVRSAADAPPGEALHIRLQDGAIRAESKGPPPPDTTVKP